MTPPSPEVLEAAERRQGVCARVSVSRALLGSVGWAGGAKVVSEAARYLRVFVLARLLAPEDFGIFGIAMFLLGVLEAFTEPGLHTALVQRRDEIQRYLSSVFTITLVRGVLLASCICACAPLAARFWEVPRAAPVILTLAPVLVLRGLLNPAAVSLQRELNFRAVFLWNSTEAVASLAVAIALASLGLGVWALAGSLLAGEMTRTGFSYYLRPWRPALQLDWRALRELTRFSRWVMASNAAVFLGLQLDSAMVAKLISPVALGFYQVGHRLAAIPRVTVVTVLSQVAFPAFSAAQEHPDRLRGLLALFWLATAATAGSFALVLALFADPVVNFVLGAKWAPVSGLISILALSHALRAVSVVPSYYFLATGRPHITFAMSAARALGLALALWPLTRYRGVTGAAWACVVGAALMAAVWMWDFARGSEQRAARAATYVQSVLRDTGGGDSRLRLDL